MGLSDLVSGTATAIITLGAFLWIMFSPPAPLDLPETIISVGSTVVRVEVAATEAARERGLSGRTALWDGKGMLFVFEKPARYAFWMKDMHFPIDILWFDARGSIVFLVENVGPDTYPRYFSPPKDSLFALEVPAGFIKARGIAPEDVVAIPSEFLKPAE